MKMKKTFCILLGGLGLCAFCGCGNNQTQQGGPTDPPTTQSVDEKTLVSYHSPEAIKNRGELKVGVRSGGFTFFKDKDGSNKGYEFELANAIAKNIGEDVKVNFVESDIDPMLDSLEKGEIDVALASIGADAKVKERFTLSDSYWPWEQNASPIYVLDSAKEKYKNLSDLSAAKIAVIKDKVHGDIVANYLSSAEVVTCENANECIEKIKKGEVDAIVAEDEDLKDALKDNGEVVKSNLIIPENPEELGVFAAMMKGNDDLKNSINNTIKTHKENGDIENWILDAYNNVLNMTDTEVND